MKRAARWEWALLIAILISFAWGTWADRTQQQLSDKVLRLHVLANSDSEADQALKRKVRDSVLETASAILADCPDRETAELRPTVFPTREYEDFTLPAGEYLALRVVLGEGEGHNWWCVVFPPLCAETTSSLSQTAMAAGLTEEEVALITESDGYQLKFKAVELWEKLMAYFR